MSNTSANRDDVLRAINQLVGVLSPTKAAGVHVADFCKQHRLPAVFFDVLRDLDGLVMDLTKSEADGICHFKMTATLYKINPDEVLTLMDESGPTKLVFFKPADNQSVTVDELERVVDKGSKALKRRSKVTSELADTIASLPDEAPTDPVRYMVFVMGLNSDTTYRHYDYEQAERVAKEITEETPGAVAHILKTVAKVECVRSFKITPVE